MVSSLVVEFPENNGFPEYLTAKEEFLYAVESRQEERCYGIAGSFCRASGLLEQAAGQDAILTSSEKRYTTSRVLTITH